MEPFLWIIGILLIGPVIYWVVGAIDRIAQVGRNSMPKKRRISISMLWSDLELIAEATGTGIDYSPSDDTERMEQLAEFLEGVLNNRSLIEIEIPEHIEQEFADEE